VQISEHNPFNLLRKQIEVFVRLSDEEWGMLLPHLEIKKLKKHQLFSEQGKKANEVGCVIEGMFRQYYTKDGIEKTTYFFFEDNLISSYISCITGKPSLVSIEALSDSIYISFPYKILQALFEKNITWQKFGRVLAEYATIGLEDRMVSLLTQTPEERYIDLLSGNKRRIIERIPQHYIANYLGITAVSMSRIRNRLMKGKSA
jgi:CRP-like cAMP-binding protein